MKLLCAPCWQSQRDNTESVASRGFHVSDRNRKVTLYRVWALHKGGEGFIQQGEHTQLVTGNSEGLPRNIV